MIITFLGVGEACDPDFANTSVLLKTGSGTNKYYILLDCGFTTPHRFFAEENDPDSLDALWISHFHGDHFFGTPLLLLRLTEMARKKPLTIAGPRGIEQTIRTALDLAYPSFLSKLTFALSFTEIDPGENVQLAGTAWRTAESLHSQHALALRIDTYDTSLFYSGDGRPTADTETLAQKCDMAIHEAFMISPTTPGHGSVTGCLDFAKKCGIRHLALVHLAREERRLKTREILSLLDREQDVKALLPMPGETYRLSRFDLQPIKE